MSQTIKDLYKAMSHKQFELCCERAMRIVESTTKEQFLDNEQFIYLLVKQKNYFLQFLNVFMQRNDDLSILKEEILVDESNLSPKNKLYYFQFPSFQVLIEKLLENDGQKLKDGVVQRYLTFSLFPALTSYFTIDFIQNNSSTLQKSANADYNQHDYNVAIEFLIDKIKVNNDKNCRIALNLLMTSMFATPNFVRLITETFQPAFSELQDKLEESSPANIDQLIDQSFEKVVSNLNKNIHLIPCFISSTTHLLTRPDEILRKCFFGLALNNPARSISYGLFHFSKPPSIELLSKIRDKIFHEKKIVDSMLTCIGKSLLYNLLLQGRNEDSLNSSSSFELESYTSEEQKQMMLYKKESLFFFSEFLFQKKEFKSFFQMFILSKTDIELINYILNSSDNQPFIPSDHKRDQIKYFRFFLTFPGDEAFIDNDSYENKFITNFEDDNFNISNVNTMCEMSRNDDVFTPSLRHLLQNSDPLPQFIEDDFPDDLNVENLLNTYLVMRGDVSSLSSRLKYQSDILRCLKDKDEGQKIQEIIKILPDTLLEMTNEIEILTVASLIEQRCGFIHNMILSYPYRQLIILNGIIALDKLKQTSKISLRNNVDYVVSNVLKNHFFENLSKVFEGRATSLEENVYILFKMTEKKKNSFFSKDHPLFFEMRDFFSKSREDAKYLMYDQLISNTLTSHYDDLISFCIESQFNVKLQKDNAKKASSERISPASNNNNNNDNNNNNNDNNNNNNDNNNNNNDNNNNNNDNNNNNNNNDNNNSDNSNSSINNNNNNDNNNNNNDNNNSDNSNSSINNNNNNDNNNNNNDNNNNNNDNNNNNNNNDNNNSDNSNSSINNNNNNDNNNNNNDNNNNNNDNNNSDNSNSSINNNNNNDNNNNNNDNNNSDNSNSSINNNNNNNNSNNNDNGGESNIDLRSQSIGTSSGIFITDDGNKKFNKNKFFIDKLVHLKERNSEILDICRESLLESSIFRKYDLFCKFLYNVKWYFTEGFPRDEEFGPDEMTSIISIVILMSQSSNINLNIKYIDIFLPLDDKCFGSNLTDFQYHLRATKTIFDQYYNMEQNNQFD
ncbi:hypothetical protein M9Y10_007852 [Tritrichomonas musculus]|uniref:VPS9 domain-containing protein n=1 Tax=Tritrichomonas musculus TaxID=1915356 RepID=A0ABR2J2N2_9EUKA